jgi:hypothetical protein
MIKEEQQLFPYVNELIKIIFNIHFHQNKN